MCIDSERVSRHHAAIQWTGDRFVLTDMGSRNGTFVNNIKIRAHPLRNGDAIMVGDFKLRFLYSSRSCLRSRRFACRRRQTNCCSSPRSARPRRVQANRDAAAGAWRGAGTTAAAACGRRSSTRRAASWAAISSFLRSRASTARSGVKQNE